MTENKNGQDSLFVFESLRFHLHMCTLNVLPPYKGALLRGALDNAFHRIVCSLPRNGCEQCRAHDQCMYISLFHPSAPADYPDAAKYGNAPPPYVLKLSTDNRCVYHPRDTLEFELSLIGRALDALPYFIMAIDQIGRRGLGKERGRYELRKVEVKRRGKNRLVYNGIDQTMRSPPPDEPFQAQRTAPVTALTLELQTPLRIKRNNKLVTRLDFATLFNSLAQRLTLLGAFYGTNKTPDLSGLFDQAGRIKTVKDQTFWYDWPRYSSRQKQLMKLGGLRGKITFEGDLTPFASWLKICEKVNVGQGTTFGLGGYRIDFFHTTEKS